MALSIPSIARENLKSNSWRWVSVGFVIYFCLMIYVSTRTQPVELYHLGATFKSMFVQATPKDVDFNVVLKTAVVNHNMFPIEVISIQHTISVNGKVIATTTEYGKTVSPTNPRTMETTLVVDSQDIPAIDALITALYESSVDFVFESTAYIDRFGKIITSKSSSTITWPK